MPYVLVVLFALGDGSLLTMQTSQQFASPLSCSMQAFIENEKARARTYVCVTRDHAGTLLANNRDDRLPAVPAERADREKTQVNALSGGRSD